MFVLIDSVDLQESCSIPDQLDSCMGKYFSACVLLFLALTGLMSCKGDTITETKYVHDTLYRGPAFVRFFAMLPNSNPTLVLKTGLEAGSSIFAGVEQRCDGSYIPITADSAYVLYATYLLPSGQTAIDSLVIPADLAAGTLWTGRIIQQSPENRLIYDFYQDSLKLRKPPAGYAYIRFFNGVNDYPSSGPAVQLFIDTNSTGLFTDVSSVLYQSMHDYVPIKVGSHIITVKGTDGITAYTSSGMFNEGGFYTARLTGLHENSTDKFLIDQE